MKDIKSAYPDSIVEVHMMVDNPMDYVYQMKEYGADYVSFHVDSTNFVRRTLTAIKEAGMKAGVVLNPSQRIDILEPLIGIFDYVVFMSVEPGYAGQHFLPGSMERLKQLSELRDSMKANFEIIIDGGVNYENLSGLLENGADGVVTGIYIVFQQPDGIAGACQRFEETIKVLSQKGEK